MLPDFDVVAGGVARFPAGASWAWRVRSWLKPGGLVVASVPNVGHWSILDELVRGRSDSIPRSLLSGTHVRFFTRATRTELFEDAGLRLRSIETVPLEPSPDGDARLARLKALPNASPDREAGEFLAVAERP